MLKKFLFIASLSIIILGGSFGCYKLWQIQHPINIYNVINVPTSTHPIIIEQAKEVVQQPAIGSSVGPTVLTPFMNAQRYFGCQTDGGCDLGTTTHRFRNLSMTGSLTTGSFTATSLTTTNLVFTNGVGTVLTTTNFAVTGALALPNNSITDAMVTDTITAINYLPLAGGVLTGGLTFTTASGTTITSTNILGTNLTITSGTSTNLYVSSLANIIQLGINSSSPIAQLAITGVSTRDPMRINSSTNAQLLALKTNGQLVVGPNSLSQTGYVTVESPTTNDYALTFTNGSTYTAGLGKQPGTSGQMFFGGFSGTTLNLWAGGVSRMVILNANGFVGINSTTPAFQLSVSGTVGVIGMTTNITGNGVCRTTTGEITDAGAAACVPSALKYKTNTSLYTKSATELFTGLVKAGAVQNYELKNKLGDPRKGLIADAVNEVDPDLVGFSADGTVNTLHFEDLVGLSVQAVSELDKRVDSLESNTSNPLKNRNEQAQWVIISILFINLLLKKKK